MSTGSNTEKIGVVLMTYGSATTADHVASYFKSIYGDRASAEVIADFENRYRLVGHSPLVEITGKQAELLGQLLGDEYVVRSGMRHSAPFIDTAIAECSEAGATKIIGIILSPQYSSFIMGGYQKSFTEALLHHGFTSGSGIIAEPWPTNKYFVQSLSERVIEKHTALEKNYGVTIPIIFTTHSLPERVVKDDPTYLQQLQATIDAVRTILSPDILWYQGYQSAGHTPEEWLKPDVTDILKEIEKDHRSPAVLIAPIQFLSDHLEILYDLDIALFEQCDAMHIAYNRINLPNTDPIFIQALASIMHEHKDVQHADKSVK